MTIGALAVREQGAGVGQLAMHRIFLEIVEGNVASRRLCEAVGFRAEGLYRDGYRDANGAFHNLIPYGMLATDVRKNGLSREELCR